MKCACRLVVGLLFSVLFLANPSTRSMAGCPPLAAGNDIFPSTAKLVVDGAFPGQALVLRLSSAGQLDTVVDRWSCAR